MAGPLEGIRVLDLGTYAIGPSAASYLGQLGAEVIRIENPRGEAFMDFEPTMGGMAASYINANMAKRSIYLDLKSSEGLDKARALAAGADVIVENRLPGVIDKLGVGYAEVAALNPSVVYVSMPGFSPRGPFSGQPALDMEIQALSGFASIEGSEGGPPELFRVYAHMDHTTALFLVQAAILGLIDRRRSGRGRRLEVGFFSSAVFLQLTRLAEYFAGGRPPERLGSVSSRIAPSQSFPCLDGRFVNISAPDGASWRHLCEALDLEELLQDARFGSNEARVKSRRELAAAISQKTRGAPAWWWLLLLRRHGVPCGPVYTFQELERDPHLRSQGLLVEVETPWGRVMRGGHPWRFVETPCDPIEGTHEPGSDEAGILKLLQDGAAKKEVASGPAAPALDGVTVLDLSSGLAGAVCTLQLADAGARVIKVEPLSGDRREEGWPADIAPSLQRVLNRDKESLAIDFGSAALLPTLQRLASRADIVVADAAGEGSGPTYEELRAANERIVYCSISPFGEGGGYAGLPASELELQGITGHMAFLGQLGEPPVRAGADVAELAGAMHAFVGTTAALLWRMSSGRGQQLSVSSAGALLSLGSHWMADFSAPDAFNGGVTHPYERPETGYRCRDRQVIFGFFGRRVDKRDPFQELCKGLGLEDLLKDPFIAEHGAGYVGVGRDAQEMKPLLEHTMTEWSSEDFLKLVHEIGGRGAPFMSYDDLYGDPPHAEVAASGVLFEIEGRGGGRQRAVRSPWSVEGSLGRGKHSPAPERGADSEALLAEAGFSESEIRDLRSAGAIGPTLNEEGAR